jgi:hypothetical protein
MSTLHVQLMSTLHVQVLIVLWVVYEAGHKGYKLPASRVVYGFLDSLFDDTIGVLQVRGCCLSPWPVLCEGGDLGLE